MSPIAKHVRHCLMVAASCVAFVGTSADADITRNILSRVDHMEVGSTTRLVIQGTKTPTFMVYKLEHPDRVVVDVANAQIGQSLRQANTHKVVRSINTWAIGQMYAHPLRSKRRSVVRVVVGLARPGEYEVSSRGNELVIAVMPHKNRPASRSGAQTQRAQLAIERAKRAEQQVVQAKVEVANAKRQARAAQQSAAIAARDLAQARAMIARAKDNTERVRRTAAQQDRRAKLELAEAKKRIVAANQQAAAQAKQARAAVAAAKKQAEKARLEYRRLSQSRTKELKQAEKKLRQASSQIAAAKKIRKEAEAMQAAAVRAQNQAKQRERAAQKAQQLASSHRNESRKQLQLAARYRAQAKSAGPSDRKKYDTLTQRAAKAVKQAELRRKAAEAAARLSEQHRKDAEKAAQAALVRERAALAAKENAEKKTRKAELDRQRAENRRSLAQRQQQHAEARRSEAVAAAKQAEAAALRAKQLRKIEENAYKKAREGHVRSVRSRQATTLANQKLAQLVKDASIAEQRAQAGRQNATRNPKAGTSPSQRAAEAALAAKLREVGKWRKRVNRLEQLHQKAARELAAQRQAADHVRARREIEERKLSALSHKSRALVAKTKFASSAPVASNQAPATIRRVDFVDQKDHVRVAIDLSSPVVPQVRNHNGKRILEFRNVVMAKGLERKLDTSRFRGPVKAVTSYRDPKKPQNVKIVVDVAGPAKAQLKHVGTSYHWDFVKTARTPRVAAAATTKHNRRGGNKRQPRVTTAAYPPPVVGGFGATSAAITHQTVSRFGKRRKVYKGRKIDLDFKDESIQNLLRALADVGGVNIVIPDSVKDRVTVRLRRVPCWIRHSKSFSPAKGFGIARTENCTESPNVTILTPKIARSLSDSKHWPVPSRPSHKSLP